MASEAPVPPPSAEAPDAGGPATVVLTVDTTAREPHALLQRMLLEVASVPDAGLRLVTHGERVVLGTHESADLRLKDATISRFHCEVRTEGGRVVLADLGSTNGTTVDGVPVREAYLRQGSLIGLGRAMVRFGVGGDTVRLEMSGADRWGGLVGSSFPMRRAFAVLEKAAASTATVLLTGETGTGKEVAAESLHRASPRADGPFVVVDCGAIPSELLESELFGHEKGAFTGAHAARVGAFAEADGGTLFLDEIGELAPELQPKLLRALEKREVKAVGANRHVPVDVRLVAATHRDLRAEVNASRFRSDLYYRVAVLEVRLPPLRERLDDLPALVDALLQRLAPRATGDLAFLRAPEFLAELARHDWPGNVRELRNHLERCLALRESTPLARGSTVAPSSLDELVHPELELREARETWTAELERRYVEQALQASGGNVTAAARTAGIDRIHLHRLLRKHGLR
jgi:DNA-binding NtrC family response regulator